MQATELLKFALEFTDEGIKGVLAGMDNAAMTPSTPGAQGGDGNHALWTLGHLAYIEGTVPQILFGEPNPVAHWEKLFGTGTKPLADASAYPPYAEVRETFHRVRAANVARLQLLSDSELDSRPRNVPPMFEPFMSTIASVYTVIALHTMVHYGQITDARRVAGLPPLL